jgi:hypothetical protein
MVVHLLKNSVIDIVINTTVSQFQLQLGNDRNVWLRAK